MVDIKSISGEMAHEISENESKCAIFLSIDAPVIRWRLAGGFIRINHQTGAEYESRTRTAK